MNKKIINALTFKFGWVGCVAGGSLVALLVAIIFLSVHFKFVAPRREAMLILIVVAIGFIADSIWLRTGVLIDPDGSLIPPLWLMALWALFGATLNHCMSWFQQNLLLAAVLGSVVGPLSYLAGSRLSEYLLKEPLLIQLVKLGVGWAIVFPLVLVIANKMHNNSAASDAGKAAV